MWHFLEVAFDGFAIPVLQKTFGWLRRVLAHPKLSPVTDLLVPSQHVFYRDVPFPAIPENVKITKPSPDEIRAQINSVPVFQRTYAASAYKDLTVCWQALFENLDPYSKECTITVKYYNPGDYSSERIACDALLTPRLKIAKENEPVIVRGTIVTVASTVIWLRDASVDFL